MTFKMDDLGVCNGKKRYRKQTCKQIMNNILREGREEYLRMYSCEFCTWWHLTSKKNMQDEMLDIKRKNQPDDVKMFKKHRKGSWKQQLDLSTY